MKKEKVSYEELAELAEALYDACRSSQGAYIAMKAVGLDSALPGFASCRRELNDALQRYEGMCKR